MIWATHIFVAILAVANDYAWLAVDPVAIVALAKTNCTLPTLDCLLQAKTFHAQLVQEHTNAYWCRVNEDSARVEHEKQAKEAHDLYVAQQKAKGDKWDKWEVSPPTIIHNDIHQTINHGIINHNTLISPTFASTCTSPPEIPRLEAKDFVARYRPSMEDRLTIGEYDFEKSVFFIFCQKTLAMCSIIFFVFAAFMALREIFRALKWIFMKLSALTRCPPPPPPSSQVQPQLPRAQPQPPSSERYTSR